MPSDGSMFPKHVVQENTYSTENTQNCLNNEQINFDDGFRQYSIMQNIYLFPTHIPTEIM